jgi:hypothetical protein
MMRHMWRIVLALVAGCGASVQADDNPAVDSAVLPPDATPDAPVDARPCAGGDQAMTAPDGSCFVMLVAPVSQADARVACLGVGAHLAILKTQAMADAALTFVGQRDAWIGLDDLQAENAFTWVDSTPLAFDQWSAGEPSNGQGQYQEDCVVIAGAPMRQWDDRPCSPAILVGAGEYSTLCQF